MAAAAPARLPYADSAYLAIALPGEVAQMPARPLTPAEAMLKDARWQLELAYRAVEKAKQQRKEAREACSLAEKQLKYERMIEKKVEKAIQREHRLAERKKDQEAFAVLWSAMTPEQRNAECDRHALIDKEYNDERRNHSIYLEEYLAKKSDISVKELRLIAAPIKAFLVSQAEKLLKLMIEGDKKNAELAGICLKKHIKGKSIYIDSQILYYARAGVDENDAVKIRTFINRLDY